MENDYGDLTKYDLLTEDEFFNEHILKKFNAYSEELQKNVYFRCKDLLDNQGYLRFMVVRVAQEYLEHLQK